MFFSKYNIEIIKNDKYLIYNTKSGKEYISEFSLNELEEMLLRLHRFLFVLNRFPETKAINPFNRFTN